MVPDAAGLRANAKQPGRLRPVRRLAIGLFDGELKGANMDNSTAYLLGTMISSFFGLYLFSWLVSLAAFKEWEPVERATATVVVAWLAYATVSCFGAPDRITGLYGIFKYVPGGVLVWFAFRFKFRRQWDREQGDLP